MTLSQFLAWILSQSGLSAAVGFVWSFLVEYVPGFKSLSPAYKRLVIFATSVLLAVLAELLRVALGYDVLTVETVWRAVWLGGTVAFAGSQVAHMRELRNVDR